MAPDHHLGGPSAILDPLFYIFAGPHIPPGRMTNTAGGAQFDFNVLFVIALPVLLAGGSS